MKFLKIILFFCFIFSGLNALAGSPIVITDHTKVYVLGNALSIYEDPSGKESLQQVIVKNDFKSNAHQNPNFGITKSAYWLKFTVENRSGVEQLLLAVENPIIDEIDLYQYNAKGQLIAQKLGEHYSFDKRKIDQSNYVFQLNLPNEASSSYYLRVKSNDQLQLPIFIGTQEAIYKHSSQRDLLFGIYVGIILIMMVYNLFVYISVKDSSYIYYVLFIFFVGLSQATLEGFGFQFLWPNNSWFAINSTIIVPVFSGITTGLFMKKFLQTRLVAANLDKGINLFISSYFIALACCFAGYNHLALQLLHVIGAIGSFYALYVGYRIHKMGIRSGQFFLIANVIFLLAVVVFVLRNVNIIPYNTFTSFILELGSAFQVSLLSFALADKINTLKREKEHSQEMALAASKENERLVKEQNVFLETKVNERTQELQNANVELNHTLHQLKDTQSQLVEAEKMASLGTLTAGIAHEINNPINFVSSNVRPLQMDIDDLFAVIAKYENLNPNQSVEEQLIEIERFKKKIDLTYVGEEIKMLLRGIEDGASRTAEIVKGLRNFSRLDESDLKMTDIHECLDSTLVVLKHSIPSFITIEKNYLADKLIECYPGKLNQALLNLLNNAIHAINKNNPELQHFIKIKTQIDDDVMKISVTDSGIGIPDEVKDRIFDPFFTTKEVGEGTGLGLSIVYNIIEKHQGKIDVVSVPNKGTTFTLLLPIKLKTKTNQSVNEVIRT
ncbi:sensor histidine kinase [Solitalea sp. MAHUQ-68]|uniref:histidine kinase n=1 Tax=Solitalea agri TaxID=2953739 RepID=A0A9X2EZS4_9SPHI|nr:7TM diverse intracellular signaling domain-containing protein [Solitalea agri]MCO4291972.1 sensor histidine kinase [Solitalea agri]